jgi:hypothetical protein
MKENQSLPKNYQQRMQSKLPATEGKFEYIKQQNTENGFQELKQIITVSY